jgi:hypothetical protein
MSEGGGSDQREVGVRPTVVAAAEAATFEFGVTLESAPRCTVRRVSASVHRGARVVLHCLETLSVSVVSSECVFESQRV